MTSQPQQLPFLACPGGQKPPPLCWVWLPWGSMTTAPEGVYTAQPDRAAAARRMTNAFTIDSVRVILGQGSMRDQSACSVSGGLIERDLLP